LAAIPVSSTPTATPRSGPVTAGVASAAGVTAASGCEDPRRGTLAESDEGCVWLSTAPGAAALMVKGRSASVTDRTPGSSDSSTARVAGTWASRPPTIGRAVSERPPAAATAAAAPSPWTSRSTRERDVAEMDRAPEGTGAATSSTSDATSRNTPVARAGRPPPAVRTRTGCT
jgi:hypothetical protein